MMKQHGGEGKGKYKGKKSDSSLPQHGGEGSMSGSDHTLMDPTKMSDYCGPGRYLKGEK